MQSQDLLAALLLGVVAHLAIFIRGEWHLRAPAVLVVHVAALTFSPVIWASITGTNLNQSFSSVFKLFTLYLCGLFGSISVYRLIFHRLRHFPGPRLAALTKLWHVYQCRDSQNHLILDAWYQKYGSFVRTGPEEITIFHPDVHDVLDGPLNRNGKSEWYDIVYPRTSPIFSRTEKDHRDRLQAWNQALASKSIKGYVPYVLEQIAILKHTIASYNSQPIPINDLMYWFAFDSMGHFGYNQNFHQMKTKTWHKAAAQQRTALTMLGSMNSVPWLINVALAFVPSIWRIKDWNGMIAFCDETMKNSLGVVKTGNHSVADWLIEEFQSKHQSSTLGAKMNLLIGNAITLTIGASDTSASSLIALFYFLAKYPEHAEKIHQEVITVDTDDIDVLASLKHLNGVINESMRLLPAALTFGTRITPREGCYVSNTFIPGNVHINTSRYTVSRMTNAYEAPMVFVPERWYSRPEMIKDKRAFAPFGVGRRQCVGKSLALAQLRLIAAKLLSAYRFRFISGLDDTSVERDMRDQLTAQLGPFELIFEAR